MDLPSIECLEEALAAYVGGLLLVSHDQQFVQRLTTTQWEIVRDDPQGRRQSVHATVTGDGSSRSEMGERVDGQ
jgi:ATPase subunit of ABC transporter with duplicated ATPase domains